LSIFWEMELQHCRIHSFVICLNGCAINECTLEENCLSREEREYNIQQSAVHQPLQQLSRYAILMLVTRKKSPILTLTIHI
jgi:hypothetical protein